MSQTFGKALLWGVTAVMYLFCGVLAAFLFASGDIIIPSEFLSPLGVTELYWSWGYAVIFVMLLYFLFSLKMVDVDELGAILFFGYPLYEVGSGLVFVPFGLCRLAKESSLVQQLELPADPEKIFRNEDKEAVPSGMFPPIRIPFGGPLTSEQLESIKVSIANAETREAVEYTLEQASSEDSLNVRLTAEVVFIERFALQRGQFIRFLRAIGSIDEARRQSQDEVVRVAFKEFARVSVAVALKNIEIYSKLVNATLETLTESWGIEFKGAAIKQINFHRKLNESIASVPESSFGKQATIVKAEAEKTKRILEGEGAAQAELVVLTKRAEGLKKMKDELGIDAAAVVGAETARAITSNPGQKTIIGGAKGFNELGAVALGFVEAAKS